MRVLERPLGLENGEHTCRPLYGEMLQCSLDPSHDKY